MFVVMKRYATRRASAGSVFAPSFQDVIRISAVARPGVQFLRDEFRAGRSPCVRGSVRPLPRRAFDPHRFLVEFSAHAPSYRTMGC